MDMDNTGWLEPNDHKRAVTRPYDSSGWREPFLGHFEAAGRAVETSWSTDDGTEGVTEAHRLVPPWLPTKSRLGANWASSLRAPAFVGSRPSRATRRPPANGPAGSLDRR
jgi:hypothetical protein